MPCQHVQENVNTEICSVLVGLSIPGRTTATGSECPKRLLNLDMLDPSLHQLTLMCYEYQVKVGV